MKRFLSIIFTFFIITNLYTQKKSKKLSIDSLTQKKTKSVGIITSYLDNNDELYLELSDSIFKRRFWSLHDLYNCPLIIPDILMLDLKLLSKLLCLKKKEKRFF